MQVGLVAGVPGGGDIAGGIHTGCPDGLQLLVDQHPVADGQAGRLGQLGPGNGAGPDQHQVAVDGAPVLGDDRLDPAVAAEAGDPGAEVQPDAVVGVQVAVDARDLGAEHPGQRRGVRADQGDLPAELAEGGGGLAADPAGPHHHHVLGAGGGGRQAVGVLPGAQVVDAVQLRPGQGQAARGRAGGQQQPLVADPLARRELELAAARVDRADRGGGAQLDVVGGVEALRGAHRGCRGRSRRAGRPWTAAGAHTAARPPRRAAAGDRRSPRRAGSRPPWRRPARRRR